MPAKIKICGISTPEALDATIAARADYAGLVFYPASPRAVTSNVAGALKRGQPVLFSSAPAAFTNATMAS
ncbi:hypothetical protein ACVWCG_24395, partial [Escherichia coli]